LERTNSGDLPEIVIRNGLKDSHISANFTMTATGLIQEGIS
jgi:hypothetical protein